MRRRPHTGGKISSSLAQHDDCAARHILAAVVADTFHDDVRTGIAHAESLARNAGNKSAAACRAVERDIADDDVFGSLERAGAIREDDQSAAGKPLAEIVVAVSLKRECHALRQNAPNDCPAPPRQWIW